MTWIMLSQVTVIAFVLGLTADSMDGAPSLEGRQSPPIAAARDGRLAAPEPRFVRDAQEALRDLGYGPGPLDGVLGPKTRTALMRYQHAEGLPATGRLDTETMVRLDIHQRVLQPSAAPEAPAGRMASPQAR
jgi:peptidoglycan hydrolase-like protein with peptidoglycan-binding domain